MQFINFIHSPFPCVIKAEADNRNRINCIIKGRNILYFMASVLLLAQGFHLTENGEHVVLEMHSTNERLEIAHCLVSAWSMMLTTSMACAPFDD